MATARPNRIQIDEYSVFLFLVVLFSQYFLANGEYIFASFATLAILLYSITQPYKPAVFSVIVLHHVLQVVAGVWQANYRNVDINARALDTSVAVIASLIGLFFLFYPTIYFQNKLPNYQKKDLKEFASTLSTQKVLTLYLIAFFIASVLQGLAFVYSGITQIIFSLLKIKWLLFLLLGYMCILKNEYRKVFYIIVTIEFILGFYSFFADFKTVIYYLLVLLVSFISVLNIKQIIMVSILGVALGALALFWTAIKEDYRAFLQGGDEVEDGRVQSVSVSSGEAFDKIGDLSENLNQDKFQSSTDQLLDRLQYTYHFAKAIENVPDRIPFQNGKNWLEVIEFTTTPRFLNPDKPVLENSVKASKYTGIRYLGKEKGVSFSLGYFAEFYIDFGFKGMMLGILALGIVYGRVYYYFARKATENPLVNYAVVGGFFLEFYAFEMDGTFLVGRFLATLVTFSLIISLFGKWFIQFITLRYDENV
ncbi:hypothetical protein ACQ33O_10050 [Ferruginibacter sp. SUN002]|uniref:hypothetical protein n=1 Tax=Ferruginibacter sp. SUN002 TaxID=2937789 RepID=UPI003D3668C1